MDWTGMLQCWSGPSRISIWPQYTLVVANYRADIVLYAILNIIPEQAPVQFYMNSDWDWSQEKYKNKTFRIFAINQ